MRFSRSLAKRSQWLCCSLSLSELMRTVYVCVCWGPYYQKKREQRKLRTLRSQDCVRQRHNLALLLPRWLLGSLHSFKLTLLLQSGYLLFTPLKRLHKCRICNLSYKLYVPLFQQNADISGWASADGSILLKPPDDGVNNISMKYSEFSSDCRQDKRFLYSPGQNSYILSTRPHFMYMWMKGIYQVLQQLLILLHTVTCTPLFCLANQVQWGWRGRRPAAHKTYFHLQYAGWFDCGELISSPSNISSLILKKIQKCPYSVFPTKETMSILSY